MRKSTGTKSPDPFPILKRKNNNWKNNSKWITDCKERGEWAELGFMAPAKGLGLGVLKPFGESGRYDVAVENGVRSGGCR
jgi:hypothetical protein